MSNTHTVKFEVIVTMEEMDGSAYESALIADEIMRELITSHWSEEDFTCEVTGYSGD